LARKYNHSISCWWASQRKREEHEREQSGSVPSHPAVFLERNDSEY
jgi:hypothetical protein